MNRLISTFSRKSKHKEKKQQQHTHFTSMNFEKRLMKEYKCLATSTSSFHERTESQGSVSDCQFISSVQLVKDSLKDWQITIQPATTSIYNGEVFELSFLFSSRYPFESPTVVFNKSAPSGVPVHPHVYSNGHICLSILTEDWSPALSVHAICLSIISMLSSCTAKTRPPDDQLYVKHCSSDPKKTSWYYHDDNV